jgi:peptide/nickel transport system substrate-binding protein
LGKSEKSIGVAGAPRGALVRAAALAVALALAAAAAGCADDREEPPAETPAVSETAGAEDESKYTPEPADDRFTVRYDSGEMFNPLSGRGSVNAEAMSLMYEGLFALDESFTPVPILCESYETGDNLNYFFEIKEGVAMSDGTVLTAEDVAYSLNRARVSSGYSGRLGGIEDVSVTDDGRVLVKLKKINGRLPALLDTPIIKSGSGDSAAPPGTGPFFFPEGALGDAKLVALPEYRDYASLPVRTVYLRECEDAEVIELFTARQIDIYTSDPAGSDAAGTRRDHEIRYCNTTVLQFIAFNSRSEALRDSGFRRAVGLAVDREYISGTVMSGYAIPAPLILSPAWSGYDRQWEVSVADPFLEMSAIFRNMGLEDSNSDLFLEYPTPDGGFTSFSLDFIVNGENPGKAEAARLVAEVLRGVGVDVRLRVLSWDRFIGELESGNFDIYYGETALPADFDLSQLVLPGGALDFGGMGSDDYTAYIEAFLTARSDYQKDLTARHLCDIIRREAVVIPILYKQYAVHTDRNVVTGMRPTATDVFFGFTDWNIDLTATGGVSR